MNNTLDLHEEFVDSLHKRIPKKSLVDTVADLLIIEKDAAYRRLSGKVHFSAREIGIISGKLNISLDELMSPSEDHVWLPFMLEHPLRVRSMDALFDVVDTCFAQVRNITRKPGETGNIYTSLPLEFFLHSPVLTRFMFFKWGYYFVGSEEFNNYGTWEMPERSTGMFETLLEVYNFDRAYYIWDESLIWTLVNEIDKFHKMRIITDEEKNQIKYALKDMLTKLEQSLNGTHSLGMRISPEMAFFVSPLHLGFSISYFASEERHSVLFQTNFSFSNVDDSPETFRRLKRWIDSFRNISTLLSRSGRIERRIFFDNQHRITDYVLGRDC